MGNSDAETPAKAPKTTSAQEQPPVSGSAAAAVYPDWSSFQAYSPMPPHGFFPSPVASSPQGHPYMWGAQHMMPPYGTPPPFVMYPHGGLYAHPSLPPGSHPFSPYAMPSPNANPEGSGAVSAGAEGDGKSVDGKEKSPMKRSKGSLGSLNMITGKNNNESGKSGVPVNGVFSQSGDSGSEDSSEGSDANSQNDSQPKAGGGQDSFEADGTQNGTTTHGSQNGIARPQPQVLNEPMPIMPMPAIGTPGSIPGPTTNLNIGMDYWGTPNPSPVVPLRNKISGASGVGGLIPTGAGGARENVPSDLWLQDERELKRQRRKQSNRESARRSRLRKQAECEELAQRVEVLNGENAALKAQLNQMRKEYEQLLSENTSLKDKIGNRGTDDPRIEKNDLLSADDNNKKHTDSDTQEGQADTMQNGS